MSIGNIIRLHLFEANFYALKNDFTVGNFAFVSLFFQYFYYLEIAYYDGTSYYNRE